METSRCVNDFPSRLGTSLAFIDTTHAGMHKHFRMLAISEHLRSHGYDPEVYTHLRIPGIWKRLSEFFNMPVIDERENNMDYAEDPNYDARFKPFDLPWQDYGEAIMQRAVADPSEAPTSPPQIDKSPVTSRKRKRGEPAVGHPKTRSSTVDDSEAENDEAPPNRARKSARSARSAKRAASKAKAVSPDDDEDERLEGSAEEEEEHQGEEEDSYEEEVPVTKPTRGGGKTWKRGRGRGRGRGKRG